MNVNALTVCIIVVQIIRLDGGNENSCQTKFQHLYSLECQDFIRMIPTLLKTQSLIKYEHIQCIQIPPFQIAKNFIMVFHVPRLVLY